MGILSTTLGSPLQTAGLWGTWQCFSLQCAHEAVHTVNSPPLPKKQGEIRANPRSVNILLMFEYTPNQLFIWIFIPKNSSVTTAHNTKCSDLFLYNNTYIVFAEMNSLTTSSVEIHKPP